jgi:hypothetical protein
MSIATKDAVAALVFSFSCFLSLLPLARCVSLIKFLISSLHCFMLAVISTASAAARSASSWRVTWCSCICAWDASETVAVNDALTSSCRSVAIVDSSWWSSFNSAVVCSIIVAKTLRFSFTATITLCVLASRVSKLVEFAISWVSIFFLFPF